MSNKLSRNACHVSEVVGRRTLSKPAEGLGGGTVVQGSAARLVRLIDLGASVHQGHGALVPPISSRIVQRCPASRRHGGEKLKDWTNSTLTNAKEDRKKRNE